MKNEPLLSLDHVQLVYRALPALQDINWQPTPGQQWACLGPNGAGKTTLAGILSGQLDHFSGEYTQSPRLKEGGVAYVCFEQAKALFERDRKLDDSETRADATDPGTRVQQLIVGNTQPDERFLEWAKRLGIESILQRGLRYISTGEMRKALLAKAILSEPALLILDSPLDGLDASSQRTLGGAIEELLVAGPALLLLLRQLEDIPDGVTHLMVMDAGTIVASGDRATVLASSAVQELMTPPLTALQSLPAPAPRPYTLPTDSPLLQLQNVNVHYGDLHVLRDVTWRLERGQHCYVSGPNGCGKSTLLSLVTGDNHKAYGQDIALFGLRRGSGESIWDIKQKFGQLDNQLHLTFARGMKAIEVVISGFFDTVGLYDDWGDDQRASAEQWLAGLGLLDIGRESFDALSFGLQRMVLLARAMVKSPAILLLDEPTLGLDGHHRKMMLRAIDHIAANSDTQVIFVSHCAGDVPDCINQHLTFRPTDEGFEVVCENL